ncbi:MAG TPA: response regulator transcription factor [Bryobacteraceae bacterium]|nr:response regulator transcription factor [Bryobacteraceae bacterium]
MDAVFWASRQSRVGQIRILLADDHTIIRSGLRLLLEQQPDFKVVAEAADGREAVELVSKEHPEVAVLDIGMPQLNGIEATQQIVSREPRTNVVILSMHSDEGYVLRALKAGARAYILKNSADADLIRAVRSVSEGKSFFSPVISKMLLEDYIRQIRDKEVEDSYDLLTPREREILQLLAEGKANKEVAKILKLSLYTVETHRGNILEKLNLHGVPELILYAVRKGIIQ